jgi:hypothetical protein
MRTATSWIFACVLLVVACSKPADSEPEALDDIPALNTKIEIAKAGIPARYSAALPASLSDMKRWVNSDEQFPPFVHVKDHVLNGDERWISRLGDAANKVTAAEQAEWARAWTDSTRFETATRSYCAPVRKIVAGPASPLRMALVGQYASSCATDAELELIVRADTPDSAVFEYYSAFQNEFSPDKHPYHPRFEAAARTLILGDNYEARGAAFKLAGHPDPRARAALRKIHAELKDQERADVVALAFYESKDPAERALTAAACRRLEKDPICTRPNSSAEVQEPEPRPKPADIDAAKALIAKLAAIGFVKVSGVDPAEAAGGDAGTVLTLAGHAWWFDVETGMFPNYHDSLMRSLAILVSPALDDAVFEEAAPTLEDDEKAAPYHLTIYTAGKRLRAEARNLGDWYDVEAVMNLMNAAMKENGSDVRFIPLPTGDQTLIILGAPKPAIDRAIQAGLIETGDAGEAEHLGKEFEAEVLKSYKD